MWLLSCDFLLHFWNEVAWTGSISSALYFYIIKLSKWWIVFRCFLFTFAFGFLFALCIDLCISQITGFSDINIYKTEESDYKGTYWKYCTSGETGSHLCFCISFLFFQLLSKSHYLSLQWYHLTIIIMIIIIIVMMYVFISWIRNAFMCLVKNYDWFKQM